MPKELNLVPNQRLDIEAARYGLVTYPSDVAKAANHRLWGGDYVGGYILSGFRVEIDNNDFAARTITVHNGVAMDREGRLITAEEGSSFANNPDLRKSITLAAGGAHTEYVMVEFDLADANTDSIAVWDPTFDNGSITDSAGNTHPAPRGKEFSIKIPTLRAQSWRIIRNNVSFADALDAGTTARTLRIPVAVIPITGGGAIDAAVLVEPPTATVIRQPLAGDTLLVCDDTRHFSSIAYVNVVSFEDIADIHLANVQYGVNDRENNTLAGIDNGPGFADIRVGDRVVSVSAEDFKFIVSGSQYDARPMFFSTTDVESAGAELANEINHRNNKYYAARALLNHYNVSAADFIATAYDNIRTVKWPTGGKRTENRVKTLQDWVMAVNAVVREMKFGEHTDRLVDGTVGSVATGGSITSLIDTTQYFDTSFIGGDLVITAGAAAGTHSILSVTGLHQLNFAAAAGAVVAADTYTVDIRHTTEVTKWVDSGATGSLNEVYRARIDRVANTWTNDLQERLRADKLPIVTVGDGTNTFGDYTGNAGLRKAIKDVATLGIGGVIYVKRGDYTLPEDIILIGSNTIIMGDGADITNIALTAPLMCLDVAGAPVENIGFEDLTLQGVDISAGNVAGRATVFRAYDITAVTDVPVLNFFANRVKFKGGSYDFTTDLVAGTGALTNVGWALDFHNVTPQEASKGITFTDCLFHVVGGGLNLTGAKGVAFNNCSFRSEEIGEAFVGMVEGVRIGDEGSSHYGGGTAYVPGEVAFNGCKFSGQLTIDTFAPYRGWIYVMANSTGQLLKIADCQFIGDPWGAFLGAAPQHAGQIQNGRCITLNGNIETNISNCQFHTYSEGLAFQTGRINIDGCSFHHVGSSISVCPTEAWVILGVDHDNVDGLIELVVNGTKFKDYYGQGGAAEYDSTTAVEISNMNPAHTRGENNSLHFKDCLFSGVQFAFDAIGLSTYADQAFPSVNFDTLSITNCAFNNIGEVVMNTDPLNNFTNQVAAAAVNSAWVVTNIIYSNNTHAHTELPGGVQAYIAFSAENMVVRGNSFNDVAADGGGNYIFWLYGTGRSLDFSGNSFTDCYPLTSGDTTLLGLGLSCPNTDLIINDNSASTARTTIGGSVQNGVYVDWYRSSATIDMFADLSFCNNKFNLNNCNFMLVSIQHSTAALDEIWEWRRVVAIGNNLRSRITSIAGFAQYGNDDAFLIAAVLRGFLGASYDGLTLPTGYIGGIDLRRFQRIGGVAGDDMSSVIIANNVINFDVNGSYFSTAANWDINSKVCVRISKWPNSTNISNNSLSGGSLIIKWTYMHPGDVGAASQYQSVMNVNNNSITPGDEGCALDINPATGWDNTGNENDPHSYIILNCSGNQILSDTLSVLGAAYTDMFKVLRLWHPDGGALDDIDLMFNWVIKDNILIGSTLIIDDDGAVATNSAKNLDGATLPNVFCFMQFLGNVRVGPAAGYQIDNIFGFDGAVGAAYAAGGTHLVSQFSGVTQGATQPNAINIGSQ